MITKYNFSKQSLIEVLRFILSYFDHHSQGKNLFFYERLMIRCTFNYDVFLHIVASIAPQYKIQGNYVFLIFAPSPSLPFHNCGY
jgi:hypothetical protein